MKLLIAVLVLISLVILYIIISVIVPIIVARYPLGKKSDDYYFNPITKNVFHIPMGNWFSLGYSQIPGIKSDSQIQFLERDLLVADNKIIFDGEIQPFEYAKDMTWNPPYLINNNKVYFYKTRGPLVEIPEADARTFRVLDSGYSRDNERVYIDSDVVPLADPDTFVRHKTTYNLSWDKTYVFFRAPKDSSNSNYITYSFPHQGSVNSVADELLFDSKFVYFFDYKNFKIRQEPYKDRESINWTSDGLKIDGRLIPRSEIYSN